MMKIQMKIKALILTTLVLLTSCTTISDAQDASKDVIDYIGAKADEITTNTLEKVESTVSETVPSVVNTILNSEGVAFLIVTISVLLGFVVIAALYLLIGSARAGWKRWVAK